jgi:O-antigen/teichoic acid export membrane protein
MTVLVIHFFHLDVEICIIILSITGFIAILIQWIVLSNLSENFLEAFKRWKFKGIIGRTNENKKFIISNVGISIADIMNKDLDITLISPLVSHDQIGIYKMSKNITMLIWRVIDPFYFAMIPEASNLIKKNKFNELLSLFKKTSVLITIVTLIGSIAVFTIFSYFGSIILNSEYIKVPTIMIWMMIGVVISGPMVCAPAILIALNKPEMSLYSSLIGTIIGLFAFTELTSTFGIIGSAIAWSISLSIGFIILAVLSFNEIRNKIAKARYKQ